MNAFRIGRRGLIAAGAAMLLPLRAEAKENWRALAEDVRAEMRWAWAHYRERAWGKDQIMPISGGAESFSIKGRPGVRAQLLHKPSGRLEMDFIVEGDEYSTHVLNAVSPAWTSSLAVGSYVVDGIFSH